MFSALACWPHIGRGSRQVGVSIRRHGNEECLPFLPAMAENSVGRAKWDQTPLHTGVRCEGRSDSREEFRWSGAGPGYPSTSGLRSIFANLLQCVALSDSDFAASNSASLPLSPICWNSLWIRVVYRVVLEEMCCNKRNHYA